MSANHEYPAATGHHATKPTFSNSDYSPTSADRKAVSTLCALLALARHSVRPLHDGGYLVSKWGYSYHAADLADRHSFAESLGVRE